MVRRTRGNNGERSELEPFMARFGVKPSVQFLTEIVGAVSPTGDTLLEAQLLRHGLKTKLWSSVFKGSQFRANGIPYKENELQCIEIPGFEKEG